MVQPGNLHEHNDNTQDNSQENEVTLHENEATESILQEATPPSESSLNHTFIDEDQDELIDQGSCDDENTTNIDNQEDTSVRLPSHCSSTMVSEEQDLSLAALDDEGTDDGDGLDVSQPEDFNDDNGTDIVDGWASSAQGEFLSTSFN